MDPDATLKQILTLLVDADHPEQVRDELVGSLRDLADWLDNGGYVPQLVVVVDQYDDESFILNPQENRAEVS